MVISTLILSCAKVGVPPGGPEDKTGPTIVSHFPESDAINAPRRMIARLEFSEPVNRPSVEAALFLSPDPRQRLRYRWSGRTLELIYLDSLDADRTYVISVGSQAKDERGNPCGTTYTIAFSTGQQIDRGSIRGWIEGLETPQAVSLWAYRIESEASVDPIRQTAEYGVQADRDGGFRFEYLKNGSYRVFAIHDRNRDGLWTPPAEPVGVPPWDVTVSEMSVPWISLRLAQQDTIAALIRSSRAVNDRLVDVRMNRPISTLAGWFVGPMKDTIAVLDAYADSAGADEWHVFPERRLTEGDWRIIAAGEDVFGSFWQDVDTFEVRARADTSRPRIYRMVPAPRSRARLTPEKIAIEFTEPIELDPEFAAMSTFVIGDSDTVVTEFVRSAPRMLDIVPDQLLPEGTGCRIFLWASSILDLSGNAVGDTTIAFDFSIWPADSLGMLVGKVVDVDSGRFAVYITAVRDRMPTAATETSAGAEFRIERLPAIQYVLEAFHDRDYDGKFSYGSVRPFVFSEPFWISSDTVLVRARWESETQIKWPSTQ